MQLKLAHKLSALLVIALATAIALIWALVAWNLRAGFGEYLLAQDQQRLQRFVAVAASWIETWGVDSLRGHPELLRPLVEQSLDRYGEPQGERRRPDDRIERTEHGGPSRKDGRPPGPPGLRPPAGQRGPPDRPPPGDGDVFGRRLALFLPNGELLTGSSNFDAASSSELPIVIGTATVALARLRQRNLPPVEVDQRFLQRQYLGLALIAITALIAALSLGAWFGRGLVRRIELMQSATHRIANGMLDVRIEPGSADELGQLCGDINTMAAALQQHDSDRRRWIAELAHELRTPLTILRGEVEVMTDGIRPFDQLALSSLRAEVSRLTRLVEDFQQLALSDARALPCTFAPLSVDDLLTQLQQRYADAATTRRLTLSCQIAPQLSTVSWDAERITQLLSNLLENSLRYTDAPGQIELGARLTSTGRIHVTVADSAPGVPPQDLPRLFQPLYRSDPSRSRKSGGSGLGLAICMAIARSHDGSLSAQHSALGGLRITLDLPLSIAAQSTPGTPTDRD